jgi:hypothetical protein
VRGGERKEWGEGRRGEDGVGGGGSRGMGRSRGWEGRSKKRK